MSRRTRVASTLLVLIALTSGSLGALPLDTVPGENARLDFLAAIWEWIVALFSPEAPTDDGSKPSLAKTGPSMDPNGGP